MTQPEISRTDLAELWQLAHLPAENCCIVLTQNEVLRLIRCVRDCAMEAEIGHEIGNFRVNLLHRWRLTDSADPAFGPVKYGPQDVEPPSELF